MAKLRIAITGGHPSPALAVIDEIKKTRPGWKIYFIGTKHSLTDDRAVSFEYKEVSGRNIGFYDFSAPRLRRESILAALKDLLSFPLSVISAILLLRRTDPDILLTFGGYLSVPLGIAAYFLRKPLYVHEQTLNLGLGNRILARMAVKIFLSWPQTAKGMDEGKTVLTGLPIREAIDNDETPKHFAKIAELDKPLLYITGGSQGAHFINSLTERNLNSLIRRFKIIHQAGESTRYADLSRLKKRESANYLVRAHIHSNEIGWVLKNASLIVSRAGMNSVAELLYLKKFGLLIPLTAKVNPEQRLNAEIYANSGLGAVLYQESASPGKFIRAIDNLWSRVKEEKMKFRPVLGIELQSPAAAHKIVEELF